MSGEGTRHRRRAAAALRYDGGIGPASDAPAGGMDAAPRVLATGHGEAAEEMVELAREHGVPVHADPQLAELLATLDAGAAIPEELYAIVAEVLIFVYEVDKSFDGSGPSPPADEKPRSAAAAPSAGGAASARGATPSPSLSQEK